MPRSRISYGLLTSQNQGGGGSKKQGLPPSVGLGNFSMNLIQRKAGYCKCPVNVKKCSLLENNLVPSGDKILYVKRPFGIRSVNGFLTLDIIGITDHNNPRGPIVTDIIVYEGIKFILSNLNIVLNPENTQAIISFTFLYEGCVPKYYEFIVNGSFPLEYEFPNENNLFNIYPETRL